MVAVICSFSCRLGSVTVNPFHVSTNEPRDTRAAEDFPKVKGFDNVLDALRRMLPTIPVMLLPNVKGEEEATEEEDIDLHNIISPGISCGMLTAAEYAESEAGLNATGLVALFNDRW